MQQETPMNDGLSRIEPLTHSRTALRRNFVAPLCQRTPGPIGELGTGETKPCLYVWETLDSFERLPASRVEPLDSPMKSSQNTELSCAVWLFGPERVAAPDEALAALRRHLCQDATLIMATECPWRGKILAPDEYAELTDEEIASSLVRAGFGAIERHVDGPFFRLWSARLEPGSAHELLSRASAMLEQKDPAAAEEVLSNLNERLSPDGVREYGLLVAACHDMAGRADQSVAALSEILEMDPGCARALCGLGRLAALGGDLDTAKVLFEQALSRQPALVAALRGKAAVAEALGDLQEAYSAVLAASDLRPTEDQLLVETVRLGRACGKQAHIDRLLRNIESRRPLSPMVSALVD